MTTVVVDPARGRTAYTARACPTRARTAGVHRQERQKRNATTASNFPARARTADVYRHIPRSDASTARPCATSANSANAESIVASQSQDPDPQVTRAGTWPHMRRDWSAACWRPSGHLNKRGRYGLPGLLSPRHTLCRFGGNSESYSTIGADFSVPSPSGDLPCQCPASATLVSRNAGSCTQTHRTLT